MYIYVLYIANIIGEELKQNKLSKIYTSRICSDLRVFLFKIECQECLSLTVDTFKRERLKYCKSAILSSPHNLGAFELVQFFLACPFCLISSVFVWYTSIQSGARRYMSQQQEHSLVNWVSGGDNRGAVKVKLICKQYISPTMHTHTRVHHLQGIPAMCSLCAVVCARGRRKSGVLTGESFAGKNVTAGGGRPSY